MPGILTKNRDLFFEDVILENLKMSGIVTFVKVRHITETMQGVVQEGCGMSKAVSRYKAF